MDIETGKRLYEYRKASGLSQEELAEKMQVSHQTISKWERAESSPNTDNLIALAKLYGVTIDELINGKESPEKFEENNKSESHTDYDDQTQQSNISFKDGVHINNASDTVDIGWRGIHVESKNGDKVHIGADGIHVDDHNKNHTYHTPPKNPWLHALLPALAVIFYLLVGFTTHRGWAVGWIVFLLIPVIETAVTAVKTKNPSVFAYPVFITAIFLALGMLFHIWHPSWIIFITIPIYYVLCDAYKKAGKNKEDDFSQYSNANTTTYYNPDTVQNTQINEKHKNITAIIISVICAATIIIVVPVICVFGFLKSDSFENIVSEGISSIFSIASHDSVFEYKNDSLYSSGSAEVAAENINEIDIEWVNGDIDIKYYDGSTISFSEPEQSNQDYSLRYLVSDNELKIKYCKSGRKSTVIDSKDLTIKIPESFALDSLDISAVSSNITVRSITADAFDIETVSGSITAGGSFAQIDISSVSGNISITDTVQPVSVEFGTVSGDFRLILPADISGFTIDYDTVSGSINSSDFNISGSKDGNKVYGDGSSEIDFESVSGDLEISKAAV